MSYIPRKYPRTLHIPQSLSVTSDDKVHKNLDQFSGLDVVITEKMDGENTTIHCEGTHARSVDGRSHNSRAWLKQYASGISHQLDPSERVCGEYVYARHSIAYDDLDTYFYGFAWFIDDVLQPWDDMVQRFSQLGIQTVPVLYRGPFHAQLIDEVVSRMDLTRQEGFVIRYSGEIISDNFSSLVGKFVRNGHVQTDKHWMYSEIIKNKLKGE